MRREGASQTKGTRVHARAAAAGQAQARRPKALGERKGPELPTGGGVLPARHNMVAVAAYYLAERRGFAPGFELDDWLSAESIIDALLRESKATEAVVDSEPSGPTG